eukprot:TRINITY_DN5096_c0_g1_i1.p1 TRINITY_DN5096_c0_g1~~TRINITY_DN5096_c0_g1_i1.p1  ORF type:complete len:369 (+),score=112.39 TRINITY_DN5096_c0_g1_i1:31-1137(+)
MSERPTINLITSTLNKQKSNNDLQKNNRPSINIFSSVGQKNVKTTADQKKHVNIIKSESVISFTNDQNSEKPDVPSRKGRRPISAKVNGNRIDENVISQEIPKNTPKLYSITNMYHDMDEKNNPKKDIFDESEEEEEDNMVNPVEAYLMDDIYESQDQINNSLEFHSITSPKAFTYDNTPRPSSGPSQMMQHDPTMFSTKGPKNRPVSTERNNKYQSNVEIPFDKPRKVNYVPYTLDDYRILKDNGPDNDRKLEYRKDTEEYMLQKAKRDKIKQYSESVLDQRKTMLPKRKTQVEDSSKSKTESKRERAKKYAQQLSTHQPSISTKSTTTKKTPTIPKKTITLDQIQVLHEQHLEDCKNVQLILDEFL